jgi:hypothetical protein
LAQHGDDAPVRVALRVAGCHEGRGERPGVRMGQVYVQHGLIDALVALHIIRVQGFTPH